jgi:hypothetical protein
MGVVLLLVALPGAFFLALVMSVFSGVTALGITMMMFGVIVSLLYLARDWDSAGAHDASKTSEVRQPVRRG